MSGKAERSRAARSPSKPRGGTSRRALARGRLRLAHEPVGGGVGRVDLRAHLARAGRSQPLKLTSSEPSENDAEDGR